MLPTFGLIGGACSNWSAPLSVSSLPTDDDGASHLKQQIIFEIIFEIFVDLL